MLFHELNEEDKKSLDNSWKYVNNLIIEMYSGERLTNTENDLYLIQKIINENIIAITETWELQALGVIIGYVLTNSNNTLNWSIVEDEYGVDPTVRYKDSTLIFNVLTMVSKRIEDGEHIDVKSLYDFILSKVNELKDEID